MGRRSRRPDPPDRYGPDPAAQGATPTSHRRHSEVPGLFLTLPPRGVLPRPVAAWPRADDGVPEAERALARGARGVRLRVVVDEADLSASTGITRRVREYLEAHPDVGSPALRAVWRDVVQPSGVRMPNPPTIAAHPWRWVEVRERWLAPAEAALLVRLAERHAGEPRRPGAPPPAPVPRTWRDGPAGSRIWRLGPLELTWPAGTAPNR